MIHVHGARHAGLHAELFTTPQGFAATIDQLGIPTSRPAAA